MDIAKMQVTLFLISLCLYTTAVFSNYTTTNGNTIVGECIMLPMFLNKPQPLCHYKVTGNWFDSSLALMEYNNWVQLQCNAHVKYEYLDDYNFPHFAETATVASISFYNCPLPKDRFATVLKKLNMKTSTLSNLPITPALKASQFEGLNLTSLELRYDERSVLARPRVPKDVVKYISTLSDFRLIGAELPKLPNTSLIEKMGLESGMSQSSLGGCSHLRELTLISWDVESLDTDKGWLATCYNLTHLDLQSLSVDSLHRVLTKASSLRKLEINNLPDRMFEIDIGITNATNIESIQIRNSQLFHFQFNNVVFASLAELDLSDNGFDRRTVEYIYMALGRAPHLKNFTLTHNPRLNLCQVDTTTMITELWSLWLPKLKRLVASRTATSELCLQNMRAQSLEHLDLSSCKVRKLKFSGLPKLNNSQLELRLERNVIEEVSFKVNDYSKFLESDDAAKPRELGIQKLHLQENRIQNFTAHSLPETLKFIDLSNNVISYIDDETANALFSTPDRRIKFAGNPIVCDCQNQVFLTSLNEHKEQVEDYTMLTCAIDGQPISNVTVSTLCPKRDLLESILFRVLLPVLLIFAGLIALVVAIYFRYGQAIKIFLYARGWCLCCLKEEELDAKRPFDVFISFSHDDEEYVVKELLTLLEKEDYKTCVHMRDWVIGEWIPKQISVSIEISRRTLIVLSRNFVKSVWGMLEFRMAHASMLNEGRARLIVVVLDDVMEADDLDPELKTYLRTNTYLEKSDPWFWDKLRFALPRRGRSPPENSQKVPADVARDFGPYGPALSLVSMTRDNNARDIPV
ncbi:toll-like receptor 2 [Hyposmocoma kahamanoa]|uniref:toll-like receptor 2 n=1 Tax=Hyposmocoma kahamanoa TaxID=1477025 RepID=UPI000E6D6950|nr:toll-like receptor 2 [Hyposmocoma kahamanoa]